MEEFSAINSGLGLACLIPTFGFGILHLHSSKEQKEKWLPKLARGDIIMKWQTLRLMRAVMLPNIKRGLLERDEWL